MNNPAQLHSLAPMWVNVPVYQLHKRNYRNLSQTMQLCWVAKIISATLVAKRTITSTTSNQINLSMDYKTNLHALLQRVDLAALIEYDGVRLRGSGEKYGACPKCGGTDRFHVKVYQGIGYFFCRQCHERRGDALEYLKWQHGLTFSAALIALGGGGRPTNIRPVTVNSPLETAPDDAWQDKAHQLIEHCQQTLWGESVGARAALGYLRDIRGLRSDTIRHYRLGYNPRPQSISGLYCAEGITLPTCIGPSIWQIRIRRPRRQITLNQPNKYTSITGSRAALFNTDTLKDAHIVLITAGEFDAMLAQQSAPHGLACLTFGSESKTPSLRWQMALWRMRRVWVAYDNDATGDRGVEKWQLMLGHLAQRARLPSHIKDLTDYWQNGGDVEMWLNQLWLPPAIPTHQTP